MADRFLTISEAEKFTGKSRSTLRRYIDGIVKAENAPDRHLLRPTREEVIALRDQTQPFAWKISEELLRRQFLKPDPSAAEGKQGTGALPGSDSARLVTVLEKSIAILERELTEKNTQIAAMNERMRESNILMKDLQQRLTLPPGKSAESQTVDDARHEPIVQPNRPGESPAPEKRRFRWFFGQ